MTNEDFINKESSDTDITDEYEYEKFKRYGKQRFEFEKIDE